MIIDTSIRAGPRFSLAIPWTRHHPLWWAAFENTRGLVVAIGIDVKSRDMTNLDRAIQIPHRDAAHVFLSCQRARVCATSIFMGYQSLERSIGKQEAMEHRKTIYLPISSALEARNTGHLLKPKVILQSKAKFRTAPPVIAFL